LRQIAMGTNEFIHVYFLKQIVDIDTIQMMIDINTIQDGIPIHPFCRVDIDLSYTTPSKSML
jgi:hypothetical protein